MNKLFLEYRHINLSANFLARLNCFNMSANPPSYSTPTTHPPMPAHKITQPSHPWFEPTEMSSSEGWKCMDETPPTWPWKLLRVEWVAMSQICGRLVTRLGMFKLLETVKYKKIIKITLKNQNI